MNKAKGVDSMRFEREQEEKIQIEIELCSEEEALKALISIYLILIKSKDIKDIREFNIKHGENALQYLRRRYNRNIDIKLYCQEVLECVKNEKWD